MIKKNHPKVLIGGSEDYIGTNKNNFKIIDVAKMISKITNSDLVFLNKDNNKNNLIKDKTANYVKDKRDYSVSFKKIISINEVHCSKERYS
jgi:hypothetical protein